MEPNLRSTLNLTDNKNRTKGVSSRSQQRKDEREQKCTDAKNDTQNVRGFTTDQRIEIEGLNVRRQEMFDRQRESALVGFFIEEGAISRQIEQAERRAESRCPEYDPNNIFWQRVDSLLEQQENVLKQMREFNMKQITKTFETDKILSITPS